MRCMRWQIERLLGRTGDCRDFDFNGELSGNLLQPALGSVYRFGDKIKSAVAERIQGGIRALGGMAAHHNHGNGISADDLAKHVDPVHPRHIQIQCHHIGTQFSDFFEPQQAVHGGSHHLDGRVALQQLWDQFPHQCGIVHHQHSDRAPHTATLRIRLWLK